MAHARAARTIELCEVAIGVLESLNATEATSAVAMLKKCQRRHLKHLDAAAAKLGAPYPTLEASR